MYNSNVMDNPTLQYLNAQTTSAAKYKVEVMCYAIQSVKNVGNIPRRFLSRFQSVRMGGYVNP